MLRTWLVAIGTILAWGALCAGRAEPSSPLAVVAEKPLTVAQFQAELDRLRKGAPARFVTLEQREALLRDRVERRAMVEAALQAGYEKDPEIVKALENMLVEKLQREKLQPRLDAVQVEDAELENYYKAHPEEFTLPAQARAAVIFIALPVKASPEKKADLLDRARSVWEQAKAQPQGEHGFGALAVQHSQDQASRYKGGETGWLARNPKDSAWPPQLHEALFALENVWDLAPLVETEEGFHVVRLLAKRPASIQPLAEVRERLRSRFVRQKKQAEKEAFVKGLVDSLKVELHLERLSELKPEAVSSTEPPPLLPPSLPQ